MFKCDFKVNSVKGNQLETAEICTSKT